MCKLELYIHQDTHNEFSVHLSEIYLNHVALFELEDLEHELLNAQIAIRKFRIAKLQQQCELD